jgi:hypothetical protein
LRWITAAATIRLAQHPETGGDPKEKRYDLLRLLHLRREIRREQPHQRQHDLNGEQNQDRQQTCRDRAEQVPPTGVQPAPGATRARYA